MSARETPVREKVGRQCHLWLENTGPFMWLEVPTGGSDTISIILLYPAHGSSLQIILNR